MKFGWWLTYLHNNNIYLYDFVGNTLELPSDRPESVTMQWVPVVNGKRKQDFQKNPGDKHPSKLYGRCESAGVAFAEWLVMIVGGKVSSPNAAARAERCHSK